MALKKNTSERAVDTVGRPNVKTKAFGSSKGTSTKKGLAPSAKGVGGKLSSENTVDEPVVHSAAYRKSDKNYEAKAETGTPRQDSSFRNRDRQGTGVEASSRYQSKLPNYPKKGPKIKDASEEDV